MPATSPPPPAPTTAEVSTTAPSTVPSTSTLAPTSTLPATSASAPPPTVAPTNPAPTSPTTRPSPPPSPSPAPTTGTTTSATAALEEASTFLHGYYDDVAAGRYDLSWSRLTSRFQRGTAHSYEYYTGFWDTNDAALGAMELVRASDDTIVVNAALRWNSDNGLTTYQFTLVRGSDGLLRIDKQSAAD